jgi:hypothetical protein
MVHETSVYNFYLDIKTTKNFSILGMLQNSALRV